MRYTVENLDKMRELIAKKFDIVITRYEVKQNPAIIMLETILQSYIMAGVTLAQLEQDAQLLVEKQQQARDNANKLALLNESKKDKKGGWW